MVVVKPSGNVASRPVLATARTEASEQVRIVEPATGEAMPLTNRVVEEISAELHPVSVMPGAPILTLPFREYVTSERS